MRALFITQDDPIYVREFFDEFFNLDSSDITIIRIILAPPMGKKSLVELVRQMWDFYGMLDFVRMGIRYVTSRAARRLPGPLRFGRQFSIAQLAAENGVPFAFVPDLNDPDFVTSVKSDNVDVIVSVAAPQIIKSDLINAPRIGCINVHNGKLPKYRGMLPNFWQIYDGNTSVATTIHRINEGIDDGAILLQEETDLLPEETLDSVIRRTKRFGATLVLTALRQLADGSAVETGNPRGDGSYHGFPTKEDVAEFRRRGHRLL